MHLSQGPVALVVSLAVVLVQGCSSDEAPTPAPTALVTSAEGSKPSEAVEPVGKPRPALQRAPSYSLVQDKTSYYIEITRPGTLLCPFNFRSTELRGTTLTVKVASVTNPSRVWRCGATRRATGIGNDMRWPRKIEQVFFVKDETTRIEGHRVPE